MKFIKRFIQLAFICLLVGCTSKQVTPTQHTSASHTTSTNNAVNNNQYVTHLKELQHTSHFLPNATKHIFEGEINAKHQAVGYHYEGYAHAKAKVVENTRSSLDKNRVYRAKITVNNIEKNAFSSFFPKEWTMQQVIDVINEAYTNKTLQSGNIYNGKTKSGVTVQMYLTENGKIISAFPLYNK